MLLEDGMNPFPTLLPLRSITENKTEGQYESIKDEIESAVNTISDAVVRIKKEA